MDDTSLYLLTLICLFEHYETKIIEFGANKGHTLPFAPYMLKQIRWLATFIDPEGEIRKNIITLLDKEWEIKDIFEVIKGGDLSPT
jgi:hypothetical protein